MENVIPLFWFGLAGRHADDWTKRLADPNWPVRLPQHSRLARRAKPAQIGALDLTFLSRPCV